MPLGVILFAYPYPLQGWGADTNLTWCSTDMADKFNRSSFIYINIIKCSVDDWWRWRGVAPLGVTPLSPSLLPTNV